jgi:hypothetical protein
MQSLYPFWKAKRKAAPTRPGADVNTSERRASARPHSYRERTTQATDRRRSSWRNGVLVSDCKESKTLKRSECGVSEGQVGAGERIDNQSWDKGHEAGLSFRRMSEPANEWRKKLNQVVYTTQEKWPGLSL